MADRRQSVFLQEMGYTLWQLRGGKSAAENSARDLMREEESDHRRNDNSSLRARVREQAETARQTQADTKPASVVAAIPESLPAMPEAPKGSEALAERARSIATMGWDDLTEAIRECRACELCRHRKQVVPGVGDRAAEWLFIGEGPGAEEDARGEPFVGQAGRLLDAMLSAIALKRGENVYIANAVKCRPEGNRTPSPSEMAACRPFLIRQIELISPKVLMLLGKAATHSVLGDDASLASLRQKTHYFGAIPAVVTYHPAYLLRNLPEKAKAWEDICLGRSLLR